MEYHFFEHLVALYGVHQLYDLHFVELMQAIEATDILPIAAGFTAEARRIRRHSDRELSFFQHLVAEDVRYWNFGSGDQIEVIPAHIIHLSFLIRQLAGAPRRGFVDHDRRLIFRIARGGVVVEKILDQRTL